jgi:hypothetical protein
LVLLPLLLRPPVLAGVVVSVAGAQHWTRETTHRPLGLGPATFSVAAVVAFLLLAAQATALLLARSRWEDLTSGWAGTFRSAVRKLMLHRAVLGLVLSAASLAFVVVRLADWSWSTRLQDTLARTTGFEAIVVLAGIAALSLAARRTGATSVVQRDEPAPKDVVGMVVGATLVALTLGLAWVVVLGKDDGGTAAAEVATSVAVGAVVWAVHHAWAQEWWPEVLGLISGGATAWLLLAEPPLGFGPGRRLFPGSWIRGDAGPVLHVVLFAFVVALVFVVGLFSRWLTTRVGSAGPVLSLLLMMAVALWGSWQLTLAWGWLSGIPTALVYGGAIAAATTLFAPFRASID